MGEEVDLLKEARLLAKSNCRQSRHGSMANENWKDERVGRNRDFTIPERLPVRIQGSTTREVTDHLRNVRPSDWSNNYLGVQILTRFIRRLPGSRRCGEPGVSYSGDMLA